MSISTLLSASTICPISSITLIPVSPGRAAFTSGTIGTIPSGLGSCSTTSRLALVPLTIVITSGRYRAAYSSSPRPRSTLQDFSARVTSPDIGLVSTVIASGDSAVTLITPRLSGHTSAYDLPSANISVTRAGRTASKLARWNRRRARAVSSSSSSSTDFSLMRSATASTAVLHRFTLNGAYCSFTSSIVYGIAVLP